MAAAFLEKRDPKGLLFIADTGKESLDCQKGEHPRSEQWNFPGFPRLFEGRLKEPCNRDFMGC